MLIIYFIFWGGGGGSQIRYKADIRHLPHMPICNYATADDL